MKKGLFHPRRLTDQYLFIYSGDVAEQIYEAYRDEAQVKRKILENVAHNHEESWKMLHVATWVYQTNISENITTLLESLLVETGHR